MAEREELGAGSFMVRTPRGTATFKRHTPRVLEMKYSGFADLELVEPIMQEMVAVLEQEQGVHGFSDLRELDGYQPELWAKAQEWLMRHRSRMAGNYVLQRSEAVAMGTRLLNLFLSNALLAYAKPADFQRKLRECKGASVEGKADPAGAGAAGLKG
ncbi:MAG TPA: hypothetical protein VK447_20385 [Myxococcaceae bacterium]|nr:hypothetical protein [Myxococcaceae bacterium]